MTRLEEIKRRAATGNHKYSWEDLKRLREQDEAKQPEIFKKQFEEHRASRTVGRSGILPMHQGCTVENFEILTPEHAKAVKFARWYIDNFHTNNGGGFIFGGNSGTGKNHLASAICNELMSKGYSCLVITVNELMQKLRACYKNGSDITEDQFIRSMIGFDLLVLDEIGLQRNSDAEKLTLNQIIDQRICRFKPTGMLTNLPAGSDNPDDQSLNSVLGVRIMDRMRTNGGKWIPFEWQSYRK
ncbi:ATP-binding protein [Vibrio fluvialis]